MPINGDGTLRLPRPEPVAYDDAMEDVAVCDATYLDETAERSLQITAILGVQNEDITERLERIYDA